MTLRATAADMVNFCDERKLRDLLSDTTVPVAGDLANNPRLTALLTAASGRLEAACFVSDLYTPEQLNALTDNAKALAAEIICALVMATLESRRVVPERMEFVKQLREQAELYIGQLRDGHRLFDIVNDQTHQEAGKPHITWPTIEQIDDRNAITRRTRNFYPDTTRDLPLRMGGG